MSTTSVEDRLAIQDVMIRYASGVDERDWDRYFSCFSEDVEITGFSTEVLHGVRAVREFVLPALAEFAATQHLIAPSWVSVAGDCAHARTDVQASHFFKLPTGRVLTLWGKYETDLVRGETGWTIVKHLLVSKSIKTSEPA